MTDSHHDAVLAATSSLVRCLRGSGDWNPILAKLDPREIGEVLGLLAEFDASLLLQLTEELVLELSSVPG